MLWIVLLCHPVTYRLLLCNKRLNKCPILEVPLSAFRMQLTSHSSWTEQDFAFIFCFWDLVITPTSMGYLEMELPIVSSQHDLAALMLASLSTCRTAFPGPRFHDPPDRVGSFLGHYPVRRVIHVGRVIFLFTCGRWAHLTFHTGILVLKRPTTSLFNSNLFQAR